VAADVEEGAAIAEAVLEAGEVVADAVEGTKPLDKAGGNLLTESRWGSPRNFTPVAVACCPMVGTNCRGILRTVAIGMT
jgi:hypothetical protein